MNDMNPISGIDAALPANGFDPVPVDLSVFDADWHRHLGFNIRVAAVTVSKTRTELCEMIDAHPETCVEMVKTLLEFAHECRRYVELADAAAARLIIAGDAEEALA